MSPDVVDMVAVYRATRLLQEDTVPPMPRLRRWVRDRVPASSPWRHGLLECPWCLSVHVAIVCAVARAACPRVWRVAAWVLASSAVTGMISATVDALTDDHPDMIIPEA